MSGEKNVYGDDLEVCSRDPLTGWHRDGYCRYRPEDGGNHLVCAKMTEEFLEYTKSQGNDLSTRSGNFPGLKEGDQWCICAGRYTQAKKADKAPEVILPATNKHSLDKAQWLVSELLGMLSISSD